jgi:hypothetical protein
MNAQPRNRLVLSAVAAGAVTAVVLGVGIASGAVASSPPDGVDVLYARAWSNAAQASHALSVEVGFRIEDPLLTIHKKGYPEMPGLAVDALPTDGADTPTEMYCSVTGPPDLPSDRPEWADVQCVGWVVPNNLGSTTGGYRATVATLHGTRIFTVPWRHQVAASSVPIERSEVAKGWFAPAR